MLQRAATRLRPDELDTVIVAQHPHVIGDNAKRSTKLHREISRTRYTLTEPLQNPSPQRMGKRLRDPSLRGLPGRPMAISR